MPEFDPERPAGAGVLAGLPQGARLRGLMAAGMVVGAALVAWPFSGTTLGDDFSYAKTALEFANTGHLRYNGWASMMLGWQAVWGALFIRVFGFSFNVLRISMMLVAGASIYLFHQVLVRFGVRRRGAFLGALTLGLTPLFLPLAASFMSDIPGLFSVLLCAAMCQRAVGAESDRGAAGWIAAAAAVNVASGTVRQICWLGVLVMVPSTAWFLRRRRGVLRTGAVSWVVGAAAVFACIRWLNRQPWTIAEHVWPGPVTLFGLRHLGVQLTKMLLYLALITMPVGVAWVVGTRRLGTRAVWRVIGCFVAMALVWTVLWTTGHAEAWLMPWLVPELAVQGMIEPHGPLLSVVVLHPGTRAVLSVLAAGVGLSALWGGWGLWTRRRGRVSAQAGACFWIMGPFSASVVALMCPRAVALFIQDRYLILLIPSMILLLVRGYERDAKLPLPAVCVWVLLPFALYGVAGLHDEEAGARADLRAVARLGAAGVPRSAVTEGFGPDEWVEVQRTGHVNNSNFAHSALGTYDPHVPGWNLAPGCEAFNRDFIPGIHPEYFLTAAPGRCFVPSGFAPVPYRAWLPPFHRATYIERSANAEGATEAAPGTP